ncbi:helix-turn-helix transcriptional regulator [Phytohabitans sp. ZYX-F-186]|uniref:Helix-turn-helix transcriptional regulator n=1 Tax=Phytohabitans maris TaxID=3071409 RepID=A0ABU0ZWX4_9ACTN|nr:helix-turn-helix transcriptional regulator [Phytohabitans sp. ZYX-F-186]MDQ7911331.1 helix-turn-helix transcriptional regulator [Phytohabitans sp. ZYX-F-186]
MTTARKQPPPAPVPTLASRGASPDADLVYRRLVIFGRAPAAALAHELGLPRRRLNRALDELASLGAAVPRRSAAQRGLTWTPTPAAEIGAQPHREGPRPHAERHPLAPPPPVTELAEQAARLGDGLRHLRTRALTRSRLAELVAVARHEHLAMNPEPVFDAEAARQGVAMDRTMLERGVAMRVLGVHAASPDPMAAHGRTAADARPAYHRSPSVPMKLLVVDRKIALFPVTPSDYDRGYLEVTQPPVVAALVTLFEQHWAASRAAEEHTMSQIALDPREQALIALLAQGHTDVTAARELSISTRSVSTIVRGLMDRFGVENRFQLGIALGAMHAITPPAKPEPAPPTDGA